MALRIQRPSVDGNWLYQDRGENDRYFTTIVYLGKHEPEWAECTNEEKIAWEEEHKLIKPEQINETEESVAQPTE